MDGYCRAPSVSLDSASDHPTALTGRWEPFIRFLTAASEPRLLLGYALPLSQGV